MTSTQVTPSTQPGSVETPPPGDTSFTIQWRNPERRLVDYVSALWQGKLLIGIAAAVSGAVGLFVALTKPNSYSSEATMMVHSTSSVGSASEAAANLLGSGQILPAQVVNAVDIVTSTVVLRRVVGRVGPKEILKPYQPIRMGKRDNMGFVERITDAMHDLQARWFSPGTDVLSRYDLIQLTETAVEMLDQRLQVWPSARGTTLNLSYRDHDPRRAQAVLETLIDEAGRHYTEMFAPPEGKNWIIEQVEAAAHKKRLAQEAVDRFQEKHGVIDFTDTQTILGGELVKLRWEQELAKLRRDENEEVIKDLQKEIKGLEKYEREVAQEQERADGVRDALETTLATKQIELAAEIARSTSGEESYNTRILRNEIASLEKLISDRPAIQPLRTWARRPNLEFQEIDSELRTRRQEQVTYRTQIPAMSELIEEKEKQLSQRRQLQEEALRLVTTLEDTTKEHKSLEGAAKTYEISRELDTRGLKALRIVEPASLPLSKEGPKRGRLILGALFGGLMLAMTWLIIRTRLGRTINSASDVTFALGRADAVGIPQLKAGNVRRYEEARSRGWI